MLRLALLGGRDRLGTFAGALVALIASSALVIAGGMPFEAALRTQPPVERYAPATVGAKLRLASTEAARAVTVVGVARPIHPVRRQAAIFLTDAEAARLAGPPRRAHAIGG